MARRYIHIGAPVTTVRTPALLEARFAEAGIAAVVETRHVEPEALAGFMADARSDTTLDGLMVTMPHKRAIIPHLAAISPTAALVGSVNAVKRLPSGDLVGAQFDGVALVRAALAAGVALAETRVLLAGFGGAGVAIAEALMARGTAGLAVVDPLMEDAGIAATLARLSAATPEGGTATVGTADEAFGLLVNATPLGMTADDPSPFTAGQVAGASWIADIVADPPRTRLAAMAAEAGKPVITGRDMVSAQIAPIFAWLQTADVAQQG